MYVKNSRFDPANPTPDNPVFWVGRIAEIMRGGRMRLHWHRETSLGSGLYVPTNNYFPEKASALQAFRAVVLDPTLKAWRTYPILERATIEEAAVAAARAAKAALLESQGVQDTLAIGSFVYLRNARFKQETESPIMPRYWVARVTGITSPDPQAALLAGRAAAAAAVATSGVVGGSILNGVPVPASVLGEGAMVKHSLTTPDGRLRLQWHREATLGGGIYVPTQHIFFEHMRVIRLVPGVMRFDARTKVWQRRPPGDASPIDSPNLKPPPPLIFPGDEALFSSATVIKPGERNPAPITNLAGGSSTLIPGVFCFVLNSKYVPGAPETANAPRYWVARVVAVAPLNPSLPSGTPPVVKVQWYMEVSPASRVYRQTPRTFMEKANSLHPLPGMVSDEAGGSWKLSSGVEFDEEATFEGVAAAAAAADAAAPPTTPSGVLSHTSGGNGGKTGANLNAPPPAAALKITLKVALGSVQGVSRADGEALVSLYALLSVKGVSEVLVTQVCEREKEDNNGGTFIFPPQVSSWLMLPNKSSGTENYSPSRLLHSLPEALTVEFFDAGEDGHPTTDPLSQNHEKVGKAVVELSRAILHVPLPHIATVPPTAPVSIAPPTSVDQDTISALASRRVVLNSDVGTLTKVCELRVWCEDREE